MAKAALSDLDRKFYAQKAREYRFALVDSICQVVFTKADGTEREFLTATTNNKLVPISDKNKPVTNVDPESTAVRCWIVDENCWRSFNAENVTRFKVIASV